MTQVAAVGSDLENMKREHVDEEGHEPNGGDGLHWDVELNDVGETVDAARFMRAQHRRQRAPSASARDTWAAAPPRVSRTRACHSAFLRAHEWRRQLKLDCVAAG